MRAALEALDHLVLATPNLTATAEWVFESTGVRASAGGRHVGRGTHNVLCSFGPTSYLEIVGPDPSQQEPVGGRPFGIDDLEQASIVSWAVAVGDMGAARDSALTAGYDPGEAQAMQRLRPDGVFLSWQLTLSPSPAVPFLLDWFDSPHPAPDAAGGLRLVSLRARHPDPGQLGAVLAALGVVIEIEHGRESLIVDMAGPNGAISFGAS